MRGLSVALPALICLAVVAAADDAHGQDAFGRVRVEVGTAMPQRGPADALVTVVIWSDFQCPFCGRAVPTLERLLQRYGDDLRLVWRDMPLGFHDRADEAAEAAREAFAQRGAGAFWAMHDLIFAHQDALTDADLEGYAQTVGLDLGRFRRSMSSRVHRDAVEADAAAAAAAGVTGTPTFFLNGRSLVGAHPYESFAALVDEELATARAAIAGGRVARAGYYASLMRSASAAPAPPGAAAEAPAVAPTYRLAVPPSAPSRGAAPAAARLVVQIISDFQCPFCARFTSTLDELVVRYGDRVRFVWRNLPLPFHASARPAAAAAMEAFAQRGDEGFWAMHDLLFEHQRALQREDLERYAAELGLDVARFRTALDRGVHDPAIDADVEAIRAAAGSIGTPGILVGDRLVMGAQPVEVFSEAIESALAEAR
jgi:protein-disulfide isomerase